MDEGNRCPFLLENDDSNIITCMCNYYSLGQAELARSLLHIVASRNTSKALRIVKTIIWHGPPKHWLCSTFVPSSAHLAWLCLIDFQDIVEQHYHRSPSLPPWMVKRLEFDVLIAQALLDGAAIQAQALTADVASELRQYHAGILIREHLSEVQTLKLPVLSLLQVTTQVSAFANFLPAHTTVEHDTSLSKAAVQQLYGLCSCQPLLGWSISRALTPTPGSATARKIQQMSLGLTADALLQSQKGHAWRYLKFLENDEVLPQSLVELFSILLIVISNVRPTPALHSRLHALVSMSTSSLGNERDADALSEVVRGSLPDKAHAQASQTLAEILALLPPEESTSTKPWEHLRQLGSTSVAGAAAVGGTAPRSAQVHFSRFLSRIRSDNMGDDSGTRPPMVLEDGLVLNDADGEAQNHLAGEESGWKNRLGAEDLTSWLGKYRDAHVVEPDTGEAIRTSFLHRSKIFESFLTHGSGGNHSALRLFSVLEDEFLRLKSAQSPLPPAFELLQPSANATSLFEVPPSFWDAYFEFTRVAATHCLEYVVQCAVNFIEVHDFGASAWLLAPFPQLKPLVILLCWPLFEDVKSRQSLLDTLWTSYCEETKSDPSKTADLLVDYAVEVLNYRLSVSWWISKLIVSQDQDVKDDRGASVMSAGNRLLAGGDYLRSKEEATGRSKDEAQLSTDVAAQVLNKVTSHSILYVMRPNLPMVQSTMLLSALQSLPTLRQAATALEHSYDLDFARCYYTVRCAMFLVERCQGTKFPASVPRQVIEDGLSELDGLLSSIERIPLKVSVLLLISSLCFMRHRHLEGKKTSRTAPASDFLVPPSVLLSFLSLLQHHLGPLASGTSAPPDAHELLAITVRLYQFTQEMIWRIFIGLKDFYTYSRLASADGFQSKSGADFPRHTPAVELASAVGAVIVGDIELEEFFEMHTQGRNDSPVDQPDDHPFLQFCTPMQMPLSLQPASFVPRILSAPVTLLHRSLKMNDYLLSRRLLQYFPALRGGACESIVQVAEKFKDLRRGLLGSCSEVDEEEELSDELLESKLGESFEGDLMGLSTSWCREATGFSGEVPLLSSLSGPLLAFYVLADLAVSAAPISEMSTHLLKKARSCLESPDIANVSNPAMPISASLLGFFRNWIDRLGVLVEVRPQFKGRASLASIILGIETLPSEPALLKSHLNRLHSQRHAIMSLVESVDLVKKGQTSAQQTLVNFLSSAIKSLTKEEEEKTDDARDQIDAEQMAEGLGSSRYLLRFLEYLAKVADLMRSASMEAQTKNKKTLETKKVEKAEARVEVVIETGVGIERPEVPEEDVEVTKLFDVLAESPKGIVARLLFELGGHKQALALSEVMDIDLVEVIVNSSWVLPVWKRGGKLRPRDLKSQYPMSMEVVQYLAEHESPLPQVLCRDAPLLATMACLERRGRRWPSWRMLHFAKEQSEGRFPSLHRWVQERCNVWHAIQWADARRGKRQSSQRSDHPVPDECDETDDDDNDLGEPTPQKDALKVLRGYTDNELQNLSVEDQLALEAVGVDHEHGMSAAYMKVVHALIAESRHEEALEICDEYLPLDSSLTDRVLHLYLNSEHHPSVDLTFVTHAELLDHECMYRVKKHTLAARLTLERYKHWDVDTAVQTVSMCLQRLSQQGEGELMLLKEMKRILQKMVTFEKILQVANRWQIWQEFENMDKQQVSEAVAHLLSLQQHDLARTLTQMYGMTDPVHSLELSRLHYLFTIRNDKTSAVNRLLSFPPAQAVSFALQLLDMFDVIHHRVLLCRMLLTRLHSWLSAEEDKRLRVLLASLQLLSTVSETMQHHFLRLLRKPVLIVECLLMNARVDLLEPFLVDFPEYRHDELILRYTRKALALPQDPPNAAGVDDALDAQADSDSDGEVDAGRGLGGKWCLTGSTKKDRMVREEHVFEEAPSIGLAEKILELCSDRPNNANSCFDICNELSLRLHDLTPKYTVGMDTSSRDDSGKNKASSDGQPLSSVRLVTFLISRLLTYLQRKFRGAREMAVQIERSLNNLDFIPLIWQVSGYKVGLSQLCNPQHAAKLRDDLIQDDYLSLALQLCEHCGGEGRGDPNTLFSSSIESAWHISADPVREAQAVALQKLHRHTDARHEFSQTQSASPQTAKTTLASFEHAMRYPPLFDIRSLEHLQSLYTFNSLQRKFYRSTAPLAPLPMFLFPHEHEETKRGLWNPLTLQGLEVPIVPIEKPGLDQKVEEGSTNQDSDMRSVETRSMAQLRAMESCLSQSVKNMKRRRGRGKVEEPADGSVDGSQTETLFVNGIKHLYPPIHSPELPRWSAFYELPKSTMTGTVAKEPPVDIPVEEGHPRPPHEEKEWSGEEIATANETEGENSGVEEAEDMLMDASYDKLMMDATRICFGCGASTNLRSQSNLWPEDNHTSSLMPASPMALPLAIPPSLATVGQRQLSKVSFTELLRFQENYGTAESLLSMLVRERQLAQACYYIFNEKVSKRLFVDVVAHHCLAHNQFHELQKVILEFDPSLRRVQEYLNVLKDFLRNRRALDLLYSYQVFTKDYVNAGLLAIQLFIASSTWDARVGHLQNAFAHLSVAHKLFRKRGKDDKEEKDTTEGVPEAADDSGQEMEAHLRRNLETVRLQMAVCEEMPEMAASLDLFGCIASQCEVAEQLLVAGQWELSQKIIDFLDLPAVELCVRASNQIATIQARSPAGSITPVVKFIEAIRKLPPVEWDSLVSNVVNIWIIEKAELKADPSAASQLIKFIQDERCRMDAHVLTGNLLSAFQIAQRLGNLQDVLHIRSCAQRAGDQELLKQMSSFLAYASPGKDYLTKNLAF